MKNHPLHLSIFSALLLVAFYFLYFNLLMPKSNEGEFVPADKFSIDNAMTPLLEMTKEPHYLGSDNQGEVRKIIISELNKLGARAHYQDGYNYNEKSKILTKPTNIVGRISGTEEGGKALLLLSHYDSAAVGSYGAADAASGVVTILESMRAFLSKGVLPKNDIIILFTDAEEVSLDGAQLFMKEHPWAKEVGLVLNFEARGTEGPSNMILETNQGNKNLIKAFKESNPKYPVTSSLMYSVYKILPNDTDSTVFRELGDIDSYFFAFIDGHYNYHTANDTYYNLSRESLAHQGSYLTAMLTYFANYDLDSLKSEKDYVYFNLPVLKLIYYPFSWIIPMVIVGIIAFLLLLFYGFSKSRLQLRSVLYGFMPLLRAVITATFSGYFGWNLLLKLYPKYNEIQQGFTYNGHWYIGFFVMLSIAFAFIFYHRASKKHAIPSLFVAPLFLWLLINIGLAIYLKGAAFFIIPVGFALLSFWYILKANKPNVILPVLCGIPAILILAPLVQFFPVGLGLKMLMISSGFTVLIFVLLLPVVGYYKHKNIWAGLFLVIAVGLFVKAHAESGFSKFKPKPNSLVYYEQLDTKKAFWTTYDNYLDTWTREYLGKNPDSASQHIQTNTYSKYGREYTYAQETTPKGLVAANWAVTADSIHNETRKLTLEVTPQRRINKIEIYTSDQEKFESLMINGQPIKTDLEAQTYRGKKNTALLHYIVGPKDNLVIDLEINTTDTFSFKVLEYSYDLMTNPLLNITERREDMMPKPFVLTDAVVAEYSVSSDNLNVETAVSDTKNTNSN